MESNFKKLRPRCTGRRAKDTQFDASLGSQQVVCFQVIEATRPLVLMSMQLNYAAYSYMCTIAKYNSPKK
eukprot:3242113-Amphidinium_carterae.1